MSDGWIHWYRRQMTLEEVATQLDRFRASGMLLENPNSHRVTAIDDTGEQVPMTVESLMNQLARGVSTGFQFWLDMSTDVYCRFRTAANGLMVQTYSLDGLSADERLQVQATMWDAWGKDVLASEALIVDLYNQTETVDWDTVVDNRSVTVHPVPDLLVMRQNAPTPEVGDYRLLVYRSWR
jgi:hypothetical protein